MSASRILQKTDLLRPGIPRQEAGASDFAVALQFTQLSAADSDRSAMRQQAGPSVYWCTATVLSELGPA